jgi:hypothetical protein
MISKSSLMEKLMSATIMAVHSEASKLLTNTSAPQLTLRWLLAVLF